MKPVQTPLDGVVQIFATCPSSTGEPANIVEETRSALELGATGLSLKVWRSRDGHAVVHDSGRVGPKLRRRPVASVERSHLPADVYPLDGFWGLLGPATAVSVDLDDAAVFDQVISGARAAGPGFEDRLWFQHPDLETLAEWRRETSAHLVLAARLRTMKQSTEQCVASLRDRGIDGMSLSHAEWTSGLVALSHRFERYAFARGLEYEREIAKVVHSGVDGVFGRDVSQMVAVANQFGD